jgi:hypothetical protein
MEWLTDKRTGSQTGLLFIIGLVVLDLIAFVVMTTQPIGPLTFFLFVIILGSVPLIAAIAYQLYGLAQSGYDVDRNSLTLQWGAIRQIVPLESVQRIMLGVEVEGPLRGFRGWRWPGLMQGHCEVPEAGLTLFYTTASWPQPLIIVTPTLSYAISPVDTAGFIESVKARYELGPTQAVAQTTQRPAFYDWPLWRDRVAWGLIGAGAFLWLLLIGLVCFRYPDLPATLPLHYDVFGRPDRSGPNSQAFLLPLIGVAALTANIALGGWLYWREQMAAYLLWGGAAIVQLLLWASAVNILSLSL